MKTFVFCVDLFDEESEDNFFIRNRIHLKTVIVITFTKLTYLPKRSTISTQAFQGETFKVKRSLKFFVRGEVEVISATMMMI